MQGESCISGCCLSPPSTGVGPGRTALFADSRRGGVDSLYEAVGKPVHRAGRCGAGDERPREPEIRYTLDGSEPDSLSALYQAPLRVDRSLTLCAKGFKAGAAPSQTLTLRAEKAVFLPPAAAARERSGNPVRLLRRGFLEGGGHRPREARLHGRDGCSFDCRSAAGGPFRLCVRRTYPDSPPGCLGILHAERRRQRAADRRPQGRGQRQFARRGHGHRRVALEAGLHACKLLYFEDYEGQELQWGWKAPGEGEFSPIPAENLFVK